MKSSKYSMKYSISGLTHHNLWALQRLLQEKIETHQPYPLVAGLKSVLDKIYKVRNAAGLLSEAEKDSYRESNRMRHDC